MEVDEAWGGSPPKGERPPGDRRTFILGLMAVILIEWLLWLLYRYISYPFIKGVSTYEGYFFHLIFAPLLGLSPLIVYWRLIRKERGTPWKFTRKNLFSSVMTGALAAALLMVVYQSLNWLIMVASGYGDPSRTVLFSDWRASEAGLFILMTITYFFVVGPVEELQYRSFLQDQLSRVVIPWKALVIASIFFA